MSLLRRYLLAVVVLALALSGTAAGAQGQPAPVESTDTTPVVGTPGLPITFSAPMPGSAFVWDFGDGSQAVTHAPIATHAYDANGSYVVVVTATGEGAPSGTANRTFRQVDVGFVHQVTTQTVWVPVPSATVDGQGLGPQAELRTAVSRPGDPDPATGATTFPTVLECTAYRTGGTGTSNAARSLVKSGYVVVRASTAGANSSGGVFDFFGPQSRAACADLVTWIAEQPWSNGKVATVGISAPGILSLLTASEIARREAAGIDVKADYVGAIGDAVIADFYRDLAYRGGIPNSQTFLDIWRGGLAGADFAATVQDQRPEYAPQKLLGGAVDLANIFGNPVDGPYWRARDLAAQTPPTVPVLLFATTGDIWPRSWPDLADWIAPAGGRVVLPAGAHGANDSSGFQPANLLCRDVACASFEQDGSWKVGEGRIFLDEVLKGIDRGVRDRPRYTVHLPEGGQRRLQQGGGEWVTFEEYPLPQTTWQRWSLDREGLVAFTPANVAAETEVVDGQTTLTFDSEELTQDLTMIGPGTASLMAEIEGADFPFVVRLLDVFPDGSTAVISRGWLLASHRAVDEARSTYADDGTLVRPYHPHDTPGAAPGLNRFDIEIEPVVNRFLAGHRIRLEISAQDQSEPAALSVNAVPGVARILPNDSSILLPVVPDAALGHAVFPRPGDGWRPR